MLIGNVLFYNNFNRVIKEMDIEEFDKMSREAFFELIIELNIYMVLKKGYYHSEQKEPKEKVLYSYQ